MREALGGKAAANESAILDLFGNVPLRIPKLTEQPIGPPLYQTRVLDSLSLANAERASPITPKMAHWPLAANVSLKTIQLE